MLTFPFGDRFSESCALVLGAFDGLHLGHRRLLSEAEKTALPVVATAMFGGKGKMLFTRREREFLFGRAGVAALCEIELAGGTRDLPAEVFLRELFSRIGAREVFCGADFRFGKDAAGTTALLEALASCPVHVLRVVKSRSGESGRPRKIAASACKELLARGDLSALNACLRPPAEPFSDCAYFISGTVEHGREVGRTYGFPTLNLTAPPEKLLPPDGVYGGLCATPAGDYPCIVNVGARPTFGVAERNVEAYLDGFSGDLYGAEVRVYPTAFYRAIEKFPSAEALKEQLGRDIRRLKESYA